MLRLFILLGLIGIAFIAGSIFATQASAQYQGQGNGSAFQGPVNPVSGAYSNSIYGVQITLPDGWAGFELNNTSGSTSVRIAPGGLTVGQGVARAPITISMTMIPINASNPAPQFPPMARTQPGVTCNDSTPTNNTANGLNLKVVTRNCSGTNANGDTVATKAKYEMTQTNSAYIILSYRANPDSGFDSQVATFDTMVGTLQIANTSQAPAVPEFPVPVIGLVVAIMVGSVVLLGRTTAFPSGI